MLLEIVNLISITSYVINGEIILNNISSSLPPPPPPPPPSKKRKMLIFAILAFLVAAVALVATYFIILPMFTKAPSYSDFTTPPQEYLVKFHATQEYNQRTSEGDIVWAYKNGKFKEHSVWSDGSEAITLLTEKGCLYCVRIGKKWSCEKCEDEMNYDTFVRNFVDPEYVGEREILSTKTYCFLDRLESESRNYEIIVCFDERRIPLYFEAKKFENNALTWHMTLKAELVLENVKDAEFKPPLKP